MNWSSSRAPALLVAVVLLIQPTAAHAQKLPLFPSLRFVLLREESIRTELKLTEDQISKIQAMFVDLIQPAEDGSFRIVIGPGMDLDDIEERFCALLGSEQKRRLDELHIQHTGPLALQVPRIQKELQLTPDQQTRIKTTLDDFREKILDATNEKSKIRTTELNSVPKIRSELDGELLKLLTPEQQRRWLMMPGKKFQFIQKRARVGAPMRTFYVRARGAGASMAMKA